MCSAPVGHRGGGEEGGLAPHHHTFPNHPPPPPPPRQPTLHSWPPWKWAASTSSTAASSASPPRRWWCTSTSRTARTSGCACLWEQAGGKAEISKVQIRPANSNSGWTDLTNKWGSAWEMSHAPPFPLDVNIVGTDGDSLTAFGVLTDKGVGKMPTNVQFRMTNPSDSGLVNSISGGGGGGMPAAYAGDKTPGSASPSPGGAPAPSSGSSSSSSSSGPCDDIPSSTYWSCADQKKWGQCDLWWMKQGGPGANGQKADKGYCRATCGACSGGASSSGRRLAGVAV